MHSYTPTAQMPRNTRKIYSTENKTGKEETRSREQPITGKVIDPNPTTQKITLTASCLNIPIKCTNCHLDRKPTPSCRLGVSSRNRLNVSRYKQVKSKGMGVGSYKGPETWDRYRKKGSPSLQRRLEKPTANLIRHGEDCVRAFPPRSEAIKEARLYRLCSALH